MLLNIKNYYEDNSKLSYVLFFTILSLTYIIYYDSLFYGAINPDDKIYLGYLQDIFNQGVTFSSLSSIFTDFVNSSWSPATISSLSIDFLLGNNNPILYHVTNTVLHVFNGMFVFFIINMLSKNKFISLLTAIVFIVHPLNVESVVWISERKGLLSAFFLLSSLYYYIIYNENNILSYKVISIALFVLSLLSKPTTISLPAILIVLDLTILNNEEKFSIASLLSSIKDKLPYFILGGGILIVLFMAQLENGALKSLDSYSLIYRIESSVSNIFAYISKIFIPINLASYYPHQEKPHFITILYFILLVILFLTVIKFNNKKNNYMFYFLFFLIQTIPMSGFFQTGNHSIANRYMYLPSIGIFFIVASLVFKLKSGKWLAAGFIVILLSFVSSKYEKSWSNRLLHWENNAENTAANYYTGHYYARELILHGFPDKAFSYFYNIIGVENQFYSKRSVEYFSGLLIEFKHYKSAKIILDKAIKAGVRNENIYFHLALVEYFHLNNKSTAHTYVEKILSYYPLHYKMNELYLNMLVVEKKYVEALNVVDKLINNKDKIKFNDDKLSDENLRYLENIKNGLLKKL